MIYFEDVDGLVELWVDIFVLYEVFGYYVNGFLLLDILV